MKKFLYIFFVLFVFSKIFAQTGVWNLIDFFSVYLPGDTIPLGTNYIAIDCADKNNCIAVANVNFQWPWNRLTTDGGETWTTTLRDSAIWEINNNYNPAKANEVAYPDTNLCIVICDTGFYWRSTDKCQTWKKGKLDTKWPLRQIDMYDRNIGGIVSSREIFFTKDGGAQWEKKDLNLPDSIKPTVYVDIFFISSESIVILCWRVEYNKYILKSNDGGKNWIVITNLPRGVESLSFVNENVGWAAGREKESSNYRDIILHTTDGGYNWSVQLDSLALYYWGLKEIYFLDENNGIALGWWWKLWRTSDGGKTWILDRSAFFDNLNVEYFIDIAYLDTNVMIGINNGQRTIYKYTEDKTHSFERNKANESEYMNIYPNPAYSNSELYISIYLYLPAKINICIFNSLGQIIDEPYESYLESGMHVLNFKPNKNFSSGVYYARLQIGEKVITKKLVVVK